MASFQRSILFVPFKISCRNFLLLFIPFALSFSETTLSSKVGGMTLDSTGSPYFVTGDLVVERGKSLTLKPGCVLLFKPYTGLLVEGRLDAEGSKSNPVIFTSINDNAYNDASRDQPQPFDWNGITISKSSQQAKLGNFILGYSTYGIKAQNGSTAINNGVFHANGQYSCTIDGKIQAVTDNFPFFYSAGATDKTQTKGEHHPSRWIVPAAIGIAGLGTIAEAAYFFIDKSKLHDQYVAESDISKMNSLKNKEKTSGTAAAVLTAASAILVPASAVLFVWQYRHGKKAVVSLRPTIRNGDKGAMVSIVF